MRELASGAFHCIAIPDPEVDKLTRSLLVVLAYSVLKDVLLQLKDFWFKVETGRLDGGDVILSVDGRKATSPNSILRILRTYEPGESFKLEVMRNKARTTVTGKLDKRD